jgi:hypothetical protein
MGAVRKTFQSAVVFLRTRPQKLIKPSLWNQNIADFSFLDDSMTLNYLITHDVGLARLGNSELAFIAGRDIRHQRQNRRLRHYLTNCVRTYNEKGSPESAGFLLCLPLDLTIGKDAFERSIHSFAQKPYRPDIWQRSPRYVVDLLTRKNVLYGCSHALRFRESVAATTLEDHIEGYLKLLNSSKSIFFAPAIDHDRIRKYLDDVTIVTIPAANAFENFEEILDQARAFCTSHPSARVLVTAGLTGTALSFELNRAGIVTLDVGQSLRHLDIVTTDDK